MLKYGKYIKVLALAAVLAAGCFYVWHRLHPREPVTFMPQNKAETPAGIEEAAARAGVPVDSGQSGRIAAEIKRTPDRRPDAVAVTTGAGLKETVEAELKKSGGDFAIVTPAEQSEPVSAREVRENNEKYAFASWQPAIQPGQPVTLNQYNIKAFPDHIVDIALYPNSARKIAAASIGWKGRVGRRHYLGPSFLYDSERKTKLMMGITYSFTY